MYRVAQPRCLSFAVSMMPMDCARVCPLAIMNLEGGNVIFDFSQWPIKYIGTRNCSQLFNPFIYKSDHRGFVCIYPLFYEILGKRYTLKDSVKKCISEKNCISGKNIIKIHFIA